MGLSVLAGAHCLCANTASPPVWQQRRPRSIPSTAPNPHPPTSLLTPSHTHTAYVSAKWTATSIIGITVHC